MSGALKKLEIQAYSKPEMTDSDKIKDKLFTTALNPEKYSRNFKTEYNSESAQGSSSSSSKYVRSDPQELDLEFLFDRTGILNNKEVGEKGVEEDVENFLNIVYAFDGDIHQPNYLKISWGTLTFNCILSEVQIEYKLFRSDGLPIRAVAKAKFKDFVNDEKRVAEEKKSSPDLTHVRVVTDGDTLPLMCYKIYGDSKYYIEIAKFNKIASFRTLTTGQQIYFPPIEKRS